MEKMDSGLSPELLKIAERWEEYNAKVREREIKFRKKFIRIILIGFTVTALFSLYLLLK